MMKVKRPRDPQEAEIIIIPMIDTMMFLLMVFIVASLTLAVQEGLPVNLPKASSAVTHQAQNITLTVTRNQRIYVNSKPVTLDTEVGALQEAKAGDSTLVIVNADAMVPHGLVVSVMDKARIEGVERFAIATATT